jgi:hypothetical protein
MNPSLRIPAKKLRHYSSTYSFEADPKLEHVRGLGRKPGYLTPNQLHDVCYWKSKRRAQLALSNSPGFVKEISSFAFRTKSEAARIGALTLLEGVSYPTASVVLHFCLDSSYPILDFRALWSLGIQKPSQYSPTFWEDYVACCRRLAKQHGLTVRELDQALWQFSKEEQRA